MKALQQFSKEYLEQSKKLSPGEVLQFLDDFKKLHQGAKKNKSILISLKVQSLLLDVFKTQCQLNGVKYQTQIKKLMEDWISKV